MESEHIGLLHISAKTNIHFDYFKFEYQYQFSKKYLISIFLNIFINKIRINKII